MKKNLCLILLLNSFFLLAQNDEKKDSLIRLISADFARLIEIDSVSYRKVEGSAIFLHNDTYLRCDTAIWNVKDEYIDALYNVQISQQGTNLYGDSLHYIINENLAQFRGSLVLLVDKDGNTLKTRHLDYNTRDSVAVFENGASMMDKDGNIIESVYGTYDAKTSIFVFEKNVQMFSDTLFFITDRLVYNSDMNLATFYGNTQGWKDENYLRSKNGWYNRQDEILNFTRDVYALTEEQELWAQDLTYERLTGNAKLYEQIQILDTVQQVIARCNELEYIEDKSYVRLEKDPAIFMLTEDDNGKRDTIFVSAERMTIYSQKMNQIDSAEIALAKERLEIAELDPIGVMRDQIKQERLKKEEEERLKQMPNLDRKSEELKEEKREEQMEGVAQSDTLAQDITQADTLIIEMPPPPPDTTKMTFAHASKDIRIYMEDMQVRCDSLVYTALDSIVRLYERPIVWSDISNQLTADSMRLATRNQTLTKGFMQSNAMIISEEVEGVFHQIRGAEMIGYFADNDLYRFDALGGTSAIYFIAEEEVYTTINTKSSKMLTAQVKERTIQKMTYFQDLKNDAAPLEDISQEERRFRDFSWRSEERPVNRYDVTQWSIIASERGKDIRRDFPDFKQTEIYFPQYMDSIFVEIAHRDSLKAITRVDKRENETISPEDISQEMNIFDEHKELEKEEQLAEEVTEEKESIKEHYQESVEGLKEELVKVIEEEVDIVEKELPKDDRAELSPQQANEYLILHYSQHISEIESLDKKDLSKEQRKELKAEKKRFKREIKRLKKEMKKIIREIRKNK